MRNAPALFTAVAALVTAPVTARNPAQPPSPEPGQAVDAIFDWATPSTPGGVVAVSQNGKVVVERAYGSADLERDVAIRPDTVFDIGSLRKQFIAAAVLLLVEEGRLSLADDVRKHLPEMPDYGHKITIDHLLTHTSGLRDWTALLPLAGGNADVLPLILRQRGLNFAPGEEWDYSNTGYVLLERIVVRASGKSFADFSRGRLFEPLGMKATAYREDLRDVVKNRALAYEKGGSGWQTAMRVGSERGGGAILSTAGDLLRWNEALTEKRLGAFVTEKLQEPAKLNNGRRLRYARGLIVDTYRGGGLVWHSGGAAGYHGWLGRLPSRGLSIAVLCNSGTVGASGLARRVADRFLAAADAGVATNGASAAPRAAPQEGGARGADVTGRAGLFFGERDGDPLRLIADGGRLRIDDGPPLLPVSADTFRNANGDLYFRSQDEFTLRFVSPDEIALSSMEGRTTRYRRARPYAPTAADLRAFAGRYESAELGAAFEVAPAKDGETGLMIRFALSPDKPLTLRSVERDVFGAGRMMARFRRDGSGKVVSFDYQNPLLRGVRFTRVKPAE